MFGKILTKRVNFDPNQSIKFNFLQKKPEKKKQLLKTDALYVESDERVENALTHMELYAFAIIHKLT